MEDLLKEKQAVRELGTQRMWEGWGQRPEEGSVLRQCGPLALFLAPEFLPPAERAPCRWDRSSGSE